MTQSVRIGCGSAFSRDDKHKAVQMAEKGNVRYLCCDRLAERTLAPATLKKNNDPSKGYNPRLEDWFRSVLPAVVENDVKIIGNFGAANPRAAGEQVAEIAAEIGYDSLSIAVVTGDQVKDLVKDRINADEMINIDKNQPIDIKGKIISANAYIGSDPIVNALEEDADIVIGGRISDLSLYVGPLRYEFGWSDLNPKKIAQSCVIGHLLECGTYATGGNLACPGYVEVPEKDNIGFPLAEVDENGEAIITKPPETGGIVTELSLTAQLCYEVHDPEYYITPDMIIDITTVKFDQIKENKVRVTGATPQGKPENLKVLISSTGGYKAEATIGWAGKDSLDKVNRTIEEIIKPEFEELEDRLNALRIDRIGVDAIHGTQSPELECPPNEVRLRVAARTDSIDMAERVLDKVIHQIMTAPMGVGGVKSDIDTLVKLHPTLLNRDKIKTEVMFKK
jgi:hypothetical protein